MDAVSAATAVDHFSFLELFVNATVFVQIIMILLLVASICSLAIIIRNHVLYRPLRHEVLYVQEHLHDEAFMENLKVEEEAKKGLSAHYLVYLVQQGAGEVDGFPYEERYQYVQRVLHAYIKREEVALAKGLSWLATIGSVSPFVGLLGTVVGIIHSFTAIAGTHQTSLAVVAPGIAEALFATALGLVAAIPATVAYNRYVSFLNEYADSLELLAEALMSKFIKPKS